MHKMTINVLRSLHVLMTEGMKEILAKLQETLRNPLMHKAMHSHMQDLLHEFPRAKEATGLEWPLSGTPNSISSRQEEDNEGLLMMHALLDDI